MARKPYESDLTTFMREFLARKPQVVEQQREGRALWWDKKLDPDDIERRAASNVPQKGYVYQTDD